MKTYVFVCKICENCQLIHRQRYYGGFVLI
jgi:ribosomal protein L36